MLNNVLGVNTKHRTIKCYFNLTMFRRMKTLQKQKRKIGAGGGEAKLDEQKDVTLL